jgi:origin recognition complex subunit 6
MSRPIEKALSEIIPRLSGPLPPELTDLASSLLAQSRSKISNLKADEEIGRTYACANLACERYPSPLTTAFFPPQRERGADRILQ